MSVNIAYPAAAEMFDIEQDLVSSGDAGRVGLQLMPKKTRVTQKVRWVQEDNYFGLQEFRGLDGRPSRVIRTGSNTYLYEAAEYGEFITITEREIRERAIPNRPEITIPIDDMVIGAQKQLYYRELDRMEYNIWTLLFSGSISLSMPGPQGPVTYTDSYSIQTFTSTVPWATSATATPLADMQTIQQLSVGHSVDFGASAKLYMNQVQANRLLNNSNASDFGGRRSQYGATLNNLAAFNSYFQGQNLPEVVIYDEGFQPKKLSGPETTPSSQFQKYIANGTAILVGKRKSGSPIGEMQMTMNLNAGGGAGPYAFTKDFFNGINCAKDVPGKIETHHGWSGGPAIYYPSAVVACTFN
jgi:hypothetical protein